MFPDYQLPLAPSSILTDIFNIWSTHKWVAPEVSDTFTAAGYYSLSPLSNHRILVLNTVITITIVNSYF